MGKMTSGVAATIEDGGGGGAHSSQINNDSSHLAGIIMELGLTPKRWSILAMYIVFGITNQAQYVIFATIVKETRTFYDVSATAVNMLAASFSIVYIIGVFPGCQYYQKSGLRGGLLLGTGANALGSLLKLLSGLWWHSYVPAIFGQISAGVGQVLFLSLPPLVASTWFPQEERTLATALGTLSGFVGMATALFYSPRVIAGDPTATNFTILFATLAVPSVAVFVACLLFAEDEPPMSPSVTARRRKGNATGGGGDNAAILASFSSISSSVDAGSPASPLSTSSSQVSPPGKKQQDPSDSSRNNRGASVPLLAQQQQQSAFNEENVSILPILKKQLRNRNLMLLCVFFGSVNGSFTGLVTVLSQITEPFGISEDGTGVMLFAGIMAGSVSCGLLAPYVDKHRIYRSPVAVIYLIASILIALAAIFMQTVTTHIAAIAFAIIITIEVIVLPAIPVTMEFCVELTFPDPESVSSSIALVSLNIWAALTTVVYSAIIGNTPSKEKSIAALSGTAGLVFVAAVIIRVFVSEDLRRKEHEEGQLQQRVALADEVPSMRTIVPC